ncbi:MAG TPA: hypothetical protein VD884_13915 [Ohtaekwangia sp.]|nr:hypothetical protein [Ohtaekwangia sp.]
MTELKYSKFGLMYCQIWFNTKEIISAGDYKGIDILELRESYTSLNGKLSPFKNGIIDLTKPVDAIFERLDKGFRYEVRRAEKETVRLDAVKDLTSKHVTLIYKFYKQFCEDKEISPISLEFFLLYSRQQALYISMAFLEGLTLQYHIYLRGVHELILLASFPGSLKARKNILGFANRALHWNDIKFALNAGLSVYNLGGMGNVKGSNATIVNFKNEMAPDVKEYFNGLIPLTLKGKLYMQIKRTLK